MALEKLEDCITAHVCPDAGITLLFSKETKVEEKALETLLKPYKLKISEIVKLDSAPY